MEKVGQGANLGVDLVGEGNGFENCFVAGIVALRELFGQRLQHKVEGHKLLSGSVVEIARHAAALFILHLKNSRGELAQRDLRFLQFLVGLGEFGDFFNHDDDGRHRGMIQSTQGGAQQPVTLADSLQA